ncbi:MAG: RpiB/LacA/LacB family sugar-phosphate isomerase [Christensenellales bacterium]|jgi:ribose 5-phosphate isomerase B
MKVIIGADGGGFTLKQAIKEALIEKGYDITDANADGPISFQDAAFAVAGGVQSGRYDRGICLCGTGMGVSIICNKHRGVYAALCESVYQARRAKVVNNTNVLCTGGRLVGNVMGIDMALAWLEAEHLEGLDPETAARVGKEGDVLIEAEERLAPGWVK